VQHERQVERPRDRLVRDVVVRGADTPRGDDEVVAGAQAARGFDDFALVVGDDFDALEGYAEGEAVLGEPGGVCVDGLDERGLLFSVQPFDTVSGGVVGGEG